MNKRFILVPLLSLMLAAGGCALIEPHEEEPEPEIRDDALTMDEDRRLRLEDLERARVEAERARERERMVMDALEDPDSPLSDRTVYFEFDSSELSEAGEELLKAHAEFLSNNSGLRVLVEGHTDERGSREYNLGLGERRAKAVRRFLSLNGVSSDQIRIVSYGEERPAELGQGEEVWSQNRRAKLVYHPEM